ncbi:MAG TPA: phosphoribosylanthranilate isomerase [Acidimicrobiia bacterium]
MTWVKVCGLSRVSEARAAAEAGADAIGLVMVPGSARVVRPDAAATIAQATSLDSYLLTMDATPSEMLDLADFIGVTGIQPYGRHSHAVVDAAIRAGLRVLLPMAVGTERVSLLDVADGVTPLLDAADPERLGGSGKRFDTELVDHAGRDWVLAGGLSHENVAEAIGAAKPWGVDASSGLESAPGRKDVNLITRFVEEAKSA